MAEAASPPRSWYHVLPRLAVRYGVASVSVWLMFLLRVKLENTGGGTLPTYILFYPAVMVVALLAGVGPGLFATAVTVLITVYWILPPLGQFAVAAPAAPDFIAAPAPQERAHVLVIDDNNEIRESIEMLLAAHGFRVSLAADGKAGLEQALTRGRRSPSWISACRS